MTASRATPTDLLVIARDMQREAQARILAGETQRSLARSYNVNQATISRLTA